MVNFNSAQSTRDELKTQVIDLDELLRLLCGACDSDVCSRGLYVALMQAKAMAANARKLADQESSAEHN
ncbi:hypothetical protein [Photobacterium leiognathi]|uniref:hypothetical protein n=1 Tax=Photobacterium leiognathi TaxID=553611 RepID=UPI002738666E|nr:hypothetical protein [Photobacterium leiognathi]